MDVNSLQLFACIVEGGNLSAAARTLSMTRSNVSRRLRALEISVGTPLMHRTTHAVSLTAAGEVLYARASNIAREVAAVEAEFCGKGLGVQGKLKIAIPRSIAQAGLSDVLIRFGIDHPEVAMEVLYSNDVKDLHAERIDIAVRIARLPIESAVVLWRDDVEQVACASPAYLKLHGAPLMPVALSDHAIIAYAAREGVIPLIAAKGNVQERITLNPRLQANDLEFVRDAACASLGIALLARYALDSALFDGRLIELLPEYSFNLNHSKLYLQAQEARYQTPLTRSLLVRIRERLQCLSLARSFESVQQLAVA